MILKRKKLSLKNQKEIKRSYINILKLIIFALFIYITLTNNQKNSHQNDKNGRDYNNQNQNKRANKMRRYSIKDFGHPSKHSKDIYNGQIQTRQLFLQNSLNQNGRLLNNQQYRNMKILTYFPEDNFDNSPDGYILNVNLQLLKKNYQIAAKYYSTVIKVYPFPQTANTKFSGNCGNIPIPIQISTNGFNVSEVDTIFLSNIYSQPNDPYNTVAFAGPCWFMRRPVISQINFRSEQISKRINSKNNFQYHQLVAITMHQMGHVFGLLFWNFKEYWRTLDNKPATNFYRTPLSNDRFTLSQVIADNPVPGSTQKIIILSLIQNYIKTLFGCNDGKPIGALLQNGQSHWDNKVFFRQLMTPEITDQDPRISALTLLLFKSTGWYADVQVDTFSWKYLRGQNQGCDFLRGINLNYQPQSSCKINVTGYQCDIGSNFGGPCATDGHVYNDLSCYRNNPQTRCYESGNTANCLHSYCISQTKIAISNDTMTQYCQKGVNQQFILNNYLYNCPKNYDSFCSSQTCPQWCNSKGFCINGACNYLQCSQYIQGCQFCQSINGIRQQPFCTQCLTGLDLIGQIQCSTSICQIKNCSRCSIDKNQQQVCLKCSQYYLLSQDKKYCTLVDCSSLNSCEKCQLIVSTSNSSNLTLKVLECTQCFFPWVLDLQFKECIVPSCSTINTDCDQCHIDQFNNLICDSCRGDLVLNNGNCFEPNNCPIVNCTACSLNIQKYQYCSQCASPLIYDSSTKTCKIPPCNSVIPHCSLCYIQQTSSSAKLVCGKCYGEWVLSSNKLCIQPTCIIKNCVTCSMNTLDQQICKTCLSPYSLSTDQKSCFLDCKKISQCLYCSASRNSLICDQCIGDYVLNSAKTLCQVPDLSLCGLYIPHCLYCQFTTYLKCGACQSGYTRAADRKSCLKNS